jgi:serine/threonine-protein kinase
MTTTAQPLQISRYEVLGELGSGAMGVVYKARDPLIDRLVALKTIGVESGADALAYRQRFFREARSAGGLNHPNIVTIHDVGESGNVAYIAMEYLSGQSLREILDSGTVLPIARIADIAAQIADGLAFAHDKGIVHRDIKPANIMVLDNGLVKITDFGIALMPSGTRTMAGTVFGSPKYISPERVRGDPVDGRSDIFSLGAVLYEMLTGLPPFIGNDLNSLLYQILSVMPMAPSSRNRNIPLAFDFIVATALAKDPAERYRAAAEMAADLRSYAALGARASPPAPPPVAAAPDAQLPMPPSAPAAPAEPAPRPAPAAAPLPASPTAPSPAPAAGSPVTRDESMPDEPTPEVLVPMLEAPPPLLPTGPVMVSPRWRNPALLAIPALLLAMIAGVTLWPRGDGTPAPVPAPVAATVEPAAGKAGNGEAGKISTKAPPPVAIASAARAEPATTTAAAPASSPAVAAAPVASPAVAAAPDASPAVAAAPAASPATELPPAKPDVVVAKPTAVLGIAVAPWGEVYVNGRKMGVSPPLTELKLAPGKYVVEIRNTTFPAYRETIDLNQSGVRIRHKFQ